jgi:cyclophilin family peptidyl-prolyl cis-trans isomerase
VSKANKRERQRLNREARREYEEALEKRRRRIKTLKGFAIVAVPVIAIGVVLSISNSGDDDDTSAAKPKTYKQAPETIIDPATTTYTAVLETSEGNITIALDAVAAPTSVNNFVFLANDGFYDGLDFHRIAKDFVIQGGDPKGDGSGGPGYQVQAELPANGYTVGSVAWAKGGNDPAGTAGSQFFIVTSDQGAANLGGPPYQYGIIGQVTQGIETVDKIAALAPASGDGSPTKKVTIKKVSIVEAPTTPSS